MKTTSFEILNDATICGDTIAGVSVITLGVAKGHDLIIDEKTLEQVVKCGNASKSGIKVKLGHDSGMEEIVGRLSNFRIVREKVLADLSLFESSPRREFILELVNKAPESFGLSISFEGNPEKIDGTSYARCAKLRSVDLVDEPAANPAGLFNVAPETNSSYNDSADFMDTKETTKCAEPTVEERLTQIESTIADIQSILAALNTAEKADEPEVHDGADMSAKIDSLETRLSSAFDAKFDAIATLIKSFGTPVAPGIAVESAKDEKDSPTDFSELRKNPEAYRKHLIAKGIFLKP
jgi:hypothetical protein